jgi:dolichol-phosphate mannosyltransferase
MRKDKTRNRFLISVVFSFYNEEAVLPELIKRLRDVFRKKIKCRYELIFVNDASTDNSLNILKREVNRGHDIKVVNMSKNFGNTVCVFAGFRYSQGDAVVYMDTDLQDPPELIPRLVKAWQEGAEVVNTVRLSRAGESAVKLWTTILGYKILRYVANVNLTINAGDFKLLSRRIIDELLKLREDRPYLRGLISWIGFNQTQIFYHREARFAGKTKFPVFSGKVISNFIDSALIAFSDVPLKMSLIVGFMVSLGAFLYLAMIFVMKFMKLSLPGWSAIMATMLLLGGVQLLTIGILGLYVNAIYRQSRNRPSYIVKDLIGFRRSDLSLREKDRIV